jgi:hypothetical protein
MPWNANLPIGVLPLANQEIGVPGKNTIPLEMRAKFE